MKLAILIVAHKDANLLNRLVVHLAEDFDVFVHIDKRSDVALEENERVTVLREYAVDWGHINLILAMLALLRSAHTRGYDRYLIISGQDIPLKSNAQITEFFADNTIEYVDFRRLPCDGWPDEGTLDRVTLYWPDSFGKNKLARLYQAVKRHLMNALLGRRPIDYEFHGGAVWVNLSGVCVSKLFNYLDNNPHYIERFRFTALADEIFFQTALHQLGDLTIVSDCLRYIDWTAGGNHPKILVMDDLLKLESSTALFARKFDSMVDEQIVHAVYEKLAENHG
ncbi:MAG: beta-1,6-N-acetylglucosaminyltransferase [Coriobacteriaceae bacterium]|nr:beta-1,6-N-acetylglucosaminyltransferase [Coriobacteriaceae bacterium]